MKRWLNTVRPSVAYLLMIATGAGALLYPFWLPGRASPNAAHSADAPLVAALLGALIVVALALEIRNGTMNGATVALLGVLSAIAGLLRLIDLPGGGNGIFFVVVLAGVAFGPRFGTLLGLSAMAVSAVVTGGVGPWLPFQMLALSWMGGGAGLVGLATRRQRPWVEVAVLVAYGWVWGFLYGAIMNLWFWPFVRDGGPLSWTPGLAVGQVLHRYWSFYVATSLAWDAAGAFANAVLIAVTAKAVLPGMRRFSHRLDPVVALDPIIAGGGTTAALVS